MKHVPGRLLNTFEASYHIIYTVAIISWHAFQDKEINGIQKQTHKENNLLYMILKHTSFSVPKGTD